MDELDRAEYYETFMKERTIENIRKQTEVPENTSGACWNCGEAVSDKRRWCNAACRDEYLTNN